MCAASLRAALVKLAAKTAFNLVADKPGDLQPVLPLIKLLLAGEAIDIRRSRLKLAQTHFDYDATAASAKELPNLRAYLSAIQDDDGLTHEEKLDRVRAILYGWNSPKSGLEDEVPSQPPPVAEPAAGSNSPKLA